MAFLTKSLVTWEPADQYSIDALYGIVGEFATFVCPIVSYAGKVWIADDYSNQPPPGVEPNTTPEWHIYADGTFSSIVTVPEGGTGLISLQPNALMAAGITSTGNMQQLGYGTINQVLVSQGAGELPEWQDFTAHGVQIVTGSTANGFEVNIDNDPSVDPQVRVKVTFPGIAYSTGTQLRTALAGDFPTLNQNTTGNAATATLAASAIKLATARGIYGSNFDGTAPIDGPVTVAYGGTGLNSVTAYGLIVGGNTTTASLHTITNGNSGYALFSNGPNAFPSWKPVSSNLGVQSVAGDDANGFTVDVADGSKNAVITVGTSVTGLLKGDAVGISAATPGTDYVIPSGNVATATLANSATILATSRNIYGNAFNGAADVDGVIAVEFGGTGSDALVPFSLLASGPTSTGNITVIPAGVTGQVLTYIDGSSYPEWREPTAASGGIDPYNPTQSYNAGEYIAGDGTNGLLGAIYVAEQNTTIGPFQPQLWACVIALDVGNAPDANSFVGTYTLPISIVGDLNSIGGYNAGVTPVFAGSSNSIFGTNAFTSTATIYADKNSGIGSLIFGSGNLTTASRNSVLGYGAGFGLTIGNDNIFIGNEAGQLVDEGSGNIIIGNNDGEAGAYNNNLVISNPVNNNIILDVADTNVPFAANRFLATPNGSTGAITLRSIVAADIPILNQNTTGTADGNQLFISSPTNGDIVTTNGSGQTLDSGKTFSTDVTFIGATNNQISTALAIKTYVDNQISGVFQIKGNWNASTNTPTLTAGIGTQNYAYIVSVAGTQTLPSGSSVAYAVGDLIYYTGTIWQEVANNNAVLSVNGQTGIVSLGIANMNDATIATPLNAQTLIYNSGTSKFNNISLSGAGTITNAGVVNLGGKFIVQGTTDSNLTNAQFLGALGTGIVKNTTTTGVLSIATSGTDYSAGTSALATGILKSTTTTGALTIAVAGDFPTLNQNTTGSAATLTTGRTLFGSTAFNGSANITDIIASTYGGTGNGFTKFSGATTAEKTYTLPDASCTLLTTNAAVTVAQGGTGQTTYTDGQLLIGNTSGNTLTKATLTGTSNQITVTNGNGSITLALPQNIATTSDVTFGTIISTGNFKTASFNSGALATQGNYIGWNQDGTGAAEFWTNPGSGSGGGWRWVSTNSVGGSPAVRMALNGITGALSIPGTVSKGGGTFKIDHPLDPKNKYLYHSFVESPEMRNLYFGRVEFINDVTEIEVNLPTYFNVLNKDFEVTLGCIGMSASPYVIEDFENNKFKIQVSSACNGLKVSWSVSGVRKDKFALNNPVIPEVDKVGKEKGTYLHPELYS